MTEIVLPWPPKECSPNHRSRSHWPKTRALAKSKEWAIWAAHGTKPPHERPIELVLTFHPPSRRRHDRDNLLASAKGLLDGMAVAWGVDDVHFRPTVAIGEPVKGGKIIVTLGYQS